MGRPKIKPEERKKQFALTISPKSYKKLENACKEKPFSFQIYLNRYIEEHIDNIIKFIK